MLQFWVKWSNSDQLLNLSFYLKLSYSIEISRSPLQISPNSFSSQIHYRKLDKEITRFLQAMRQTACSEE
ncbi:hypothetical protein CDL15_Pgr021226 [Punica granatum]|uniref:Uncharacterized protein n=1 Tax=Punica granatum TaxID=22663 RepID=A0A218WPY8_PUNGR|nr:hypothetical protein CDL15_Pgr021226 [Punica granatum]